MTWQPTWIFASSLGTSAPFIQIFSDFGKDIAKRPSFDWPRPPGTSTWSTQPFSRILDAAPGAVYGEAWEVAELSGLRRMTERRTYAGQGITEERANEGEKSERESANGNPLPRAHGISRRLGRLCGPRSHG